MGILILEADVKKDLRKFLSLLNENRTRHSGIERFEWLYLQNPRGPAKVWFAVDEKSGKEVAFTCALPRLFRVKNREVLCWNCGDFSVTKRFRTLGVAVKLRRAAKECVDKNETEGLYAHPNDRMKVIHEKVGHHCIGTMLRFARPLNVKGKIEERIQNRFITAALSPIGNLALSLYDKFVLKRESGYDTLHVTGTRFGPEFDDLFNEVSQVFSVIGDRGSEYLNWRFFDTPLYDTERIEIKKNGKLAGYIVYTLQKGVATFRDMVCIDNGTAEALLSHWVRLLKRGSVRSASVILMDQNPLVAMLKSIGFMIRPETSQVYAYAGADKGFSKEWITGQNWYMTVGDRDV